MTEDERRPPQAGGLSAARQRTIDILCRQFAEDRIAVEEFERRVDLANQAQSPDDLKALLADLHPRAVPAPMAADNVRVAPRGVGATSLGPRRPRDFMIGIMGAAIRAGRWRPARSTLAIGVMGGSELDFRNAALPPGVTEVTAVAVMGGVEIIVPPDVHVETAGMGILGGFEDKSEDAEYITDLTPVIRIKGIACMGGIEITTRHPGESAGEAKRRQRALRRRRRKRLSGPLD